MFKIEKAPESMSAKERVRRTFAYEKTDRVPIGIDLNPVIRKNLFHALGISENNGSEMLDALGVDTRAIGAPYTGKPLFKVPENRAVDQMEGCIMRWVEHASGGYWDFCDFPLKDATDEMFDNFPVPNPDDFDYSVPKEVVKRYDGKYALFIGSPSVPDILNSNGRIMGVEDVLCNLIMENEAALRFIKRRADFQLKHMERILEQVAPDLDYIWLGEDLGTQIGPMISLDLYRDTLKPIHKQFADLANSYNLPTLMHTCGSSSWAYEDFIEIGIKGVDTLQPEAANMSTTDSVGIRADVPHFTG